jgi:Flp pilus assembly protein TadB
MPKRATLRASDADRDQVAERLRKAATEGRIFAHELEERMATALRAKTYGELDAVTADLPGVRVTHPGRQRPSLTSRPVAMGAYLIAATVVLCVLAMVVLAGIVALSGVWMIFAFFFLVRRAGSARSGRHHHGHYRRGIAGRW